jgi:adenylylsulfate kinase
MGLPGSGKTTLAGQVKLPDRIPVRLDGDTFRSFPQFATGFSAQERFQHLTRAGATACLLVEQGFTVLASFITPYREVQSALRDIFLNTEFHLIYLNTPAQVCQGRDPKGLWRRAAAGEIPNFTGLAGRFDPPKKPELVIPTHEQTIEESLQVLQDYIRSTNG